MDGRDCSRPIFKTYSLTTPTSKKAVYEVALTLRTTYRKRFFKERVECFSEKLMLKIGFEFQDQNPSSAAWLQLFIHRSIWTPALALQSGRWSRNMRFFEKKQYCWGCVYLIFSGIPTRGNMNWIAVFRVTNSVHWLSISYHLIPH